ncbi:hypothetical protein PHYBOEH_006764 [Phytophthora boehmeriae]|uniref:Uncharacterized protein n=1 Tax=Phytophthora boehmeriae TaxID=109152 RepID=A0A8T1WHX2_9STRA|nr:hypothetical protein PHYBOEH_006764 [Phytophthora boehmeriae]
MASRAYLSWLQKREFKVLRSPGVATRSDTSASSPLEASKTATVASFLPRPQRKLPEQKNLSATFGQEKVWRRLSTAGKRPRSYRSQKDAVSAAEAEGSAQNARKKDKLEVPGTTKLSEKRAMEGIRSGQVTGKKRQVDASLPAQKKRRSMREDDGGTNNKEESRYKRMERRLGAILGESQYWQAVDRFSHLD